MMRVNKQTKFLLLFGLPIFIIAVAVWSLVIEPDLFFVNQYEIKVKHWPSALDGLKIALVADLHAGGPYIGIQKIRDIVNRTNAAHPDVILLLGDYVYGGRLGVCPMKPDVFSKELAGLKAPLGVFAIGGNHDWWYSSKGAVRDALEANQIPVLENSSRRILYHDQPLWIVGLPDIWTRKLKLKETLAEIPDGDPLIVLSHNPDVFPDIPERVSLTVAGHTHGGQVSLPFIGPAIVPSKYGARFARGLIVEDGRSLFVSSGIGTSIFPIRFMVPPEVSVLRLYGSDTATKSVK